MPSGSAIFTAQVLPDNSGIFFPSDFLNVVPITLTDDAVSVADVVQQVNLVHRALPDSLGRQDSQDRLVSGVKLE